MNIIFQYNKNAYFHNNRYRFEFNFGTSSFKEFRRQNNVAFIYNLEKQ